MDAYLSLMTKIPAAILLMLSATSVVSGDYFAKLWSVNRSGTILALALVAYACSGIFYTPTLVRNGLVVTSLIWSLVSTVGFLVIGFAIFKENLTLAQGIGVAFGVVSLVVLAFTAELK
jgi:multidrug transporter EmrE-like cation transporter